MKVGIDIGCTVVAFHGKPPQYLVYILNYDDVVMPDLIRHPEPVEFTGFRLPPE